MKSKLFFLLFFCFVIFFNRILDEQRGNKRKILSEPERDGRQSTVTKKPATAAETASAAATNEKVVLVLIPIDGSIPEFQVFLHEFVDYFFKFG